MGKLARVLVEAFGESPNIRLSSHDFGPYAQGPYLYPNAFTSFREKICVKILLDKKTTTNNMAFHK
jgi:hypothetical protein